MNSTSIEVSSASPFNSPSPSRGVSVADEEERAFLVDRQVDGDSFADAVVIHVAAPGPEPAGAERLVGGRRDAHAAEHGLELHAEVLEPLGGFGERGGAGLPIEFPVAVEVVLELGVAVIAGLNGAGDDPVAATGASRD